MVPEPVVTAKRSLPSTCAGGSRRAHRQPVPRAGRTRAFSTPRNAHQLWRRGHTTEVSAGAGRVCVGLVRPPNQMPIRAIPRRLLPHSAVPFRQRTADERSKGLTAVFGDQASDLLLPGQVFTFGRHLRDARVIGGAAHGLSGPCPQCYGLVCRVSAGAGRGLALPARVGVEGGGSEGFERGRAGRAAAGRCRSRPGSRGAGRG